MFQDWRDSIRADTFLWIKGPPGCGKSTVATRVIELLKAEKPTAYFFCDLEDPKRRDFDQILKTWTWQLLLQKRYLADHVFDIYLETVGTETPIESFQRALEYLVKNGDPCYLVVDGLDECHASSFEMQRTLWKLMDHAKILVISRWEYWIVQGFPLGEMTRTIEVLPADTSKDLERYICKRVQELRLDIKTAEKVANVLVAGAQGMFLWAQLITEYLSQQVTLNDTLMALEDLPDGLEALYDRLSRRIKSLPPSRFKIALKLLQWTFSGLRQLSLQELAVALAIEPGEDRLNPRNSVIDLRTFVRESCCSLLEVDEARNIIRFVHSSALEFFKRAGKHRQNSKFMGSNDPAFIATTSSFYCAAICLTYLSYDDINFVPEDIDPLVYSDNLKVHLDQHVFLEYCALNWWKHLPILGTESDGDEEILSRSIKIFTSSQRSLVRWLQLFQMLDGFKNDESLQASLFRSSESPYSSSFMHNSSFFHHFWLAPSRLFTRWQRWKTESFFKSRGFFTPIGIASFFDFVDVVKSEHESGKSIDARDACGLTSLMLAAHGESPSTLQYAIKNGANVRLATCYGYGVARYASRNCISVLPQVLQAGALISPATLDDGRNALHSASASVGFHPFVIQELLKYCTVEDLNAKDFWGKTALHYVAAIDIEPYVKLTMGRFSATGGVPLKQRQIHIASREEAFTPSSRIEIEAWITAWGSLLSEADSTLLAGEINEKNVSMIVQKIKTTMILWLGNRGASVNEKDNLGQIPLDLALKTGFAEYLSITDVLGVDRVSKALLALGYGTSDGDPSNRRLALDEAVVRGHLITVKALLALNTTSSILSTAEKESILSMIKHKESAPHPRTRLKAVFSKPQASYQPETSLEVSRTSLILQFCLKRSSCGFRYAESDCDRLVTRVLDFAEYWVRSTSEIGTEDNANGVGHALNQDLSARITMNTGQLRKIEIYLAPSQFIMHRLTSYHSSFPNNSRSKEDDGEFHAKYSSHEPKLNLSILSPRRSSRVPSSNSQSLWQKSNVQRAPTLEIMRRSNILSENSSSEWLKDVLKDGAKIPVPFEMFQWVKHTFGADHHPLLRQHIVGMQTWSLPFDPENAASMTDLQRQQIERWLTSFSKGDEIILQPTHEFFAQDIALYSGFALAVYTA